MNKEKHLEMRVYFVMPSKAAILNELSEELMLAVEWQTKHWFRSMFMSYEKIVEIAKKGRENDAHI